MIKNMNIIIYVKTGCPWCKDVLDYLNKKKIKFEERNVLTNEEFFKEMLQKSGQTKTPTLDIDGHILADSDVDQVSAYLEKLKV